MFTGLIGTNITTAVAVPTTGFIADWNADVVSNGDLNWLDSFASINMQAFGTVYAVNSGAINGHKEVVFNGSTNGGNTVGTITQAIPLEIWTIHKVITWTLNGAIWAGTGGADAIAMGPNGTTPQLGAYMGGGVWSTNNNGDLAVGTYGLCQTVVNGNLSTLTINNGSPITLLPAGSNNLNGSFYFGNYAGSSVLNCAISRCIILNPGAGGYSASALRTALMSNYGL